MHIVIMGCGRVGSTLAQAIEARGHSVAIIDKIPEAFRRLGATFSGTKVTGVGFDRGVLTEAGIEQADAFAAVSSGDNSNIISARVARETFGVPRVAARIYDARRAEVYERLGIPTVASVRWAADQMLHTLMPEGREEIWRDPSGSVAMLEISVHPNWVGQGAASLEQATGARVAYIGRFGQGTLPTDSTVIQDGDQVSLLVTDDMADKVITVAGRAPEGGR